MNVLMLCILFSKNGEVGDRGRGVGVLPIFFSDGILVDVICAVRF